MQNTEVVNTFDYVSIFIIISAHTLITVHSDQSLKKCVPKAVPHTCIN